jgi:hypothetical protein
MVYTLMAGRWGSTVSALFLFVAVSYQIPLHGGGTLEIVDRDSLGDNNGQQIGMIPYIHPKGDSKAWNHLLTMDSNKVSFLVANVLNGPDSQVNQYWKDAIISAKGTGKKIIGYVRTGYLGLSGTPENPQYKTRLGSSRISDWVAQIEEDVEMWYKLYPGMIDGIFFDEGWNACGSDGKNTKYSEIYDYLNANTKRNHPNAYTVLNPGIAVPQCFENSADTLLTYAGSYSSYLNNVIYKPLDWTPKDHRKIWHILYNVPSSNITQAASLAHERGAGVIEILDTDMPYPYNKLPSKEYMQIQMDAVAGGVPLVDAPKGEGQNAPNPTTSNPSGLDISKYDYTSVSLNWNASGSYYELRVNGQGTHQFLGGMNDVEIGGLSPGATYTFDIDVWGPGGRGNSWSLTSTKSVTLPALPASGPISQYSVVNTAGSTTIKADVLVPYGYVRVFFWDTNNCNLYNDPAWPVNYDKSSYVCARYMVENDVFYKYTGRPQVGDDSIQWVWTPMPEVKITTETLGYTKTWDITIGSSTFDTTKYSIQGEGFFNTATIVSPMPSN